MRPATSLSPPGWRRLQTPVEAMSDRGRPWRWPAKQEPTQVLCEPSALCGAAGIPAVNGGEEVNYSGCQDGSRSTTRPLVTWAVVPVARVTVWMWKGRPSSWSPPRAKAMRVPSGDQDERDPAVVAGEGRP